MNPVVVFVDDEPNILRGLRRFTRSKKDEWEMHFFDNGMDAKAYIQKNNVDIVVSDMRMPEMSGADLFEYISAEAPNIARILLSGEAERCQTYRTVGRSHRFLAKPCDPEMLINTIDSVLTLKSNLGPEYREENISIFNELRSTPEVFQKLHAVLDQKKPSLEKIADLIKADQNLSIRILQIVNSAYFGRPLSTCSIERAVKSIGVTALRDLLDQKRLGNAMTSYSADSFEFKRSKKALELANHTARQVEQSGATSTQVDMAYLTGLLSTLGIHKNAVQKDKTTFHPPLRAGYFAGLLGLPFSITTSLLAMSTFDMDAPVDHNAQCILDAMMSIDCDAA